MPLTIKIIGRSDKPFDIYTSKKMANDIYELINTQLKWNNFHLVGHSMGGMISLELAMMNSHMIKSLCLYATHNGRVLPPLYGLYLLMKFPFASVQGKDKLIESLVNIQFPQSYLDKKSQLNPQKTNREIHSEDLQHEIEYGSGISHALGISGQILAITGHYVSKKRLLKLKSELEKQKAPILVITGTEDYLVDCKNSFYLSKVLKCELVVMKDAGHMLHQERPNEFNRALLKHFKSTFIKSKL